MALDKDKDRSIDSARIELSGCYLPARESDYLLEIEPDWNWPVGMVRDVRRPIRSHLQTPKAFLALRPAAACSGDWRGVGVVADAGVRWVPQSRFQSRGVSSAPGNRNRA